MSAETPHVVLVAGPNGAGKSTSAPHLVRDHLGIGEYVNADVIANGLSGFHPDRAAIQAGRIMLERMDELASNGEDFAFETTLASRTFAPWLRSLKETRGYRVILCYVWLKNVELAVERVRHRVQHGGHDVSDEVIRRRYDRGLSNFFTLYRDLADVWVFFDNSAGTTPRLVARKSQDGIIEVVDETTWNLAHERAGLD